MKKFMLLPVMAAGSLAMLVFLFLAVPTESAAVVKLAQAQSPGGVEADHPCSDRGGCGGSSDPSVTIYASPNPVSYGGNTNLHWDTISNGVYGASKSCVASGGWSGTFTGDQAKYGGDQVIYSLSTDTIFYITCYNTNPPTYDSQSATAYAYVSVTAPPTTPAPTITFTASPTTVSSGGSTTLTWTVTNATSCSASGHWSGARSPYSGSEVRSNLRASQSYYLSCYGPGGSAYAAVGVTVATPAPTLAFTAFPATIPPGGSSTLYWSVQYATTCSASGHWSGGKSPSGSSEVRSNLRASQSYYLSCYGPGGSAYAAVGVTVANPAPTVTLTADPTTVPYGGSSTLAWTVQNATSCSASNGWFGSKSTAGGTELQTGILADTTYTLTCTGPGGHALRSATVAISAGTGGSIDTCDGSTLVRRNSSVCITYDTGTSDPAQCVIKTGSQTIQSNLSQSGTFTHSFSAETPVTLYCDGGGHTREVTVRVVPEFQEI